MKYSLLLVNLQIFASYSGKFTTSTLRRCLANLAFLTLSQPYLGTVHLSSSKGPTNIRILIMATKDFLVIYGFFAIVTALLIAKDVSHWREKVLQRLPAALQESAILQGTVKPLLILIPSLFWPVILAISFLTIVIGRIALEIKQCRGRRLAHRQMEQNADLERTIRNSRNGEHPHNTVEHDDRARELSLPSLAMVPVTEPPPVYTPYVPVHTIHQGQWQRASDRSAEQHCFLLYDCRTPAECLRSSGRVSMIPSR